MPFSSGKNNKQTIAGIINKLEYATLIDNQYSIKIEEKYKIRLEKLTSDLNQARIIYDSLLDNDRIRRYI